MRRILAIALLLVGTVIRADVHSSEFTDPWQVYAHDLMRESIPFQTVRGNKQVVPFAEFLANKFVGNGFAAKDVHLLPMDSDGEPSAALVVRYQGASNKRPVLFLAHMDVVQASGEDWGRDPFSLSEEDGYFYGRGVLDDKFGTTVLTTTFLRLKSEGFVPERDLVIAFTGDEESKMETIDTLVRDHRELIDAEVAMNLDAGVGRLNEDFEPIATFLQYAEKTYVTYELTASNSGGHSSKPRADNAIFDIAGAIQAIQNYEFPVRSNADARAYFSAMGPILGGELGAAMTRFAADPNDTNASNVLSSDPEYVGIVRTTCIPTMLRGGHVENALPEAATVTVNCRVYPGVDIADIAKKLQAIVNNPDIKLVKLGDPASSPPSPVREDIMAIVQQAVDQRYAGSPVIPYLAPYGTDGSYLRRGGITTYGLMGMFIRAEDENPHSAGEKLPVQAFFNALDFWHAVVQDLAEL